MNPVWHFIFFNNNSFCVAQPDVSSSPDTNGLRKRRISWAALWRNSRHPSSNPRPRERCHEPLASARGPRTPETAQASTTTSTSTHDFTVRTRTRKREKDKTHSAVDPRHEEEIFPFILMNLF